jgi:hypothetical protein
VTDHDQLEALGLLTTAGQLQARAVRMAFQALPDNDDSRWTDDQTLGRAAHLATIAAAGARIAYGLIAIEHVGLLREWTMADEDGRLPYTPPTLSGPYGPDREHDR